MTALENLMMVPADQPGENLVNAFFRRGRVMREERGTRGQAEDVIDFLQARACEERAAPAISPAARRSCSNSAAP